MGVCSFFNGSLLPAQAPVKIISFEKSQNFQWRIQNFPDGGDNLKGGNTNPLFWSSPLNTARNWIILCPDAGRALALPPPPDMPMTLIWLWKSCAFKIDQQFPNVEAHSFKFYNKMSNLNQEKTENRDQKTKQKFLMNAILFFFFFSNTATSRRHQANKPASKRFLLFLSPKTIISLFLFDKRIKREYLSKKEIKYFRSRV